VDAFGRAAPDAAVGRGDRALFQHHSGPVGRLKASGLPALPAYRAGGGLYSYGAGSMAQYAFDPQWTAHAIFEYERLTGSAADSPLVTQRGSPDQFTYGLGVTYSFAMHPWW
jgi:long-subunit fatty acid transport protein